MSGHTVVHRGPGLSVKGHVLNAHIASVASVRAWRIAERREAVAALFAGRGRVWVNEEAARYCKRRSLIDDNPTSG